MIRKVLILMAVMVSPAFGQETPYTNPTQIPVADQTYTVIQQQTATPIENIKQSGTALTLYDDGVSTNLGLSFDFYYYGNLYDSIFVSQNGFISFTSQANGCCNGTPLPNITEWNEQNASYFQYINVNNSIFAMWSDLADFSVPGNPYYQSFDDRFVVGWYGIDELGTANKFTYEITLFSNNDFMINYGAFDYAGQTGRIFTSGFQGDQANEFYQIYNGNDPSFLQNTSYLIQSSAITLPPPVFLYWNRVAGEYEQFTLTEETVVRYGANGVYSYQTLEAGTYDCGNSVFGDPIGGVVKSCEIGTNELPVVETNCATNPLDPKCVIDSIINDIDEPMLAEETFPDPVVDEDITEDPELVAAIEETIDNSSEEEIAESLEELLADTDDDADEVLEKEVFASSPVKEMENEEKASALTDSISKDVLESALSIATVADANAGSAGTNTASESSSSSSSRSSNVSGSVAESTVSSTESNSSSVSFDSSGQEQSAAGDASMELLETGRSIGQEALASTMAATESSASDSISQAEGIAQTSSFESMAASSTAEIVNVIEIENVIETNTVESNIETDSGTTFVAETASDANTTSNDFDMNFGLPENPSAAFSQEAEDVALAILNNNIPSSEEKTFDDETNTDAEITNAIVDPAFAIANTFNQAPSMMNLEILGIVKPIEEKSDAERRAEQVVAANKEEQEKINSNYMDADQSGIVAAIAVDADVSSYLSARMMDNNIWYKPEDIYKNVVIKDNVRGSYFLEKGNTDTYKKMVEEQYK